VQFDTHVLHPADVQHYRYNTHCRSRAYVSSARQSKSTGTCHGGIVKGVQVSLQNRLYTAVDQRYNGHLVAAAKVVYLMIFFILRQSFILN
jgi:hypothetical protein